MEILPIYKTHLYRITSGKLVLISHDFQVGKIGFWALKTSIIVCLKSAVNFLNNFGLILNIKYLLKKLSRRVISQTKYTDIFHRYAVILQTSLKQSNNIGQFSFTTETLQRLHNIGMAKNADFGVVCSTFRPKKRSFKSFHCCLRFSTRNPFQLSLFFETFEEKLLCIHDFVTIATTTGWLLEVAEAMVSQ